MTASDVPAVAAYLICFVSVAIFAQRRLATPMTNRSSTRLRLYRQAEFGYVACTLILFVVLSSALEFVAMRQLLVGFGLAGTPQFAQFEGLAKLPAPLVATVLLTVWLPNVILVRDVDGWLLASFKTRANIPLEVQNRADRLTPEILRVTEHDLRRLADFVVDENLPEELTGHLAVRGEGLQLSRFRFTRLLKLFAEVTRCAQDARCQKLFQAYDQEWQAAQQEFRAFCGQAATGLGDARKLQSVVSMPEYERLMEGRREAFREASGKIFKKLALLAAGAVLSREDTEHGIGKRFRAMGFDIADSAERVDFPLRSLSGLAVCLLFYIVVADLALRRMHLVPDTQGMRSPVPDAAQPLFVLLSHAVTIGATVWLVQAHPTLQRREHGRARWDVYVLCSLIGAAILAAAWVALFLLRYKEVPRTEAEWNMVIAVAALVGSLCGPVAYFCDLPDDLWSRAALPGVLWGMLRQFVEGLVCLAFMAFVAGLLLLEFDLPIEPPEAEQSPLSAAVLVLFPASVAFIVGFFVPQLCRAERALARRRTGQATGRAGEAGLPDAPVPAR